MFRDDISRKECLLTLKAKIMYKETHRLFIDLQDFTLDVKIYLKSANFKQFDDRPLKEVLFDLVEKLYVKGVDNAEFAKNISDAIGTLCYRVEVFSNDRDTLTLYEK